MSQQMTIEEALAFAKELHRNGDLSWAVGLYRDVGSLAASQRGQLHYLSALAYAQVAQWKTAEAESRKAAEAGIDTAENRWLLSYVTGFRERRGEEIHPDDLIFVDLVREALGLSLAGYGHHLILGRLYEERCLFAAAELSFRRAIAAGPDCTMAHMALSTELLRKGAFREGAAEMMAWLNKTIIQEIGAQPHHRSYQQMKLPEWQGEEVDGLLLVALFGFGDIVQFARYLPRAARRARRIVLVCHPEMQPLIGPNLGPGGIPGTDNVELYQGGKCGLEEFQAKAALELLPFLFEEGPSTIVPIEAYLKPDAARVAAWAEELGDTGGVKVGICWATGGAVSERSLPLDYFDFLQQSRPDTRIYSLQQPPRSDDLNRFIAGYGVDVIDFGSRLKPFAELAAFIANLDLVITIDTVVPQVAAAQGCPTWMLLRYAADWRQFGDQTRSRWHRSIRLFRQPAPGDAESNSLAVREAWRRFLDGERVAWRKRDASLPDQGQ